MSRSESLTDRPSSRVLAAPGGKSSFSLAHDDYVPAAHHSSSSSDKRNKSSIFEAPEEPKHKAVVGKAQQSSIKFGASPKQSTAAPAPHVGKAQQSSIKFSYSPQVAAVTKSDCQQQRNKSSVFEARSPLKPTHNVHPVAGVKLQTTESSPKPVTRSSTRVLAAPGGQSSIVFG